MSIRFTNNAATTLSSGINASVTSIPLTDGSAFPALGPSDDYAYITIADSNNVEVVKATSRSGNTLTVVRGQDGSTASAFASGQKVELRLPAQALTDIAEKYASYKLFEVPDGNYTFTGNNYVPDGEVLASGETWELLGDSVVTVLETTSWDSQVTYYEESATVTGKHIFHNELLMTGDAVVTLDSNAEIIGFAGSTGPGVAASGSGGSSGVTLAQVFAGLSVVDETEEDGLGSLTYDTETGAFTFTGTTPHTPATGYATVFKFQF